MYHVAYKFRQGSTERAKKWTENFHIDLVDLPTAGTVADKLAALLVPLHGKQSVLTGYRITDVAFTRAGTLRIPGKNGVPSVSLATFDADYPTTGLQIQSLGADGSLVESRLRGLKDDIIKGGDKVADPAWDPLFVDLKSFIETKSNHIALWVHDPNANSVVVNSISEAGVVTIPIADWGGVKRVILTGRGLPKYFRRSWDYTLTTPTTVQLRGFKVQTNFQFVNMSADLTADQKKVVAIAQFDFIRATSLKVTKEKN